MVVDALVELGRYGAAERAVQRMVDAKPNLASYARVSYFRELHGDLDGAVRAMRLAIAAGGPVRENVAYVQSLLGGLELARGRADAARRAYDEAVLAVPGYVPALAGLARLDAARGDLDGAIRRWRRIVARLPLPEYVVGLGDSELGAGRRADARRDLALVDAERRLLAAAASTPTSSSRCMSQTTATGRAALRSRGGRGQRRRACAPPTRSAGR